MGAEPGRLQAQGWIRGECAVAVVTGEVDSLVADEFERFLVDLLGTSRMLQIDLSGVTFFDSTALRVLIGCEQLVVSRGGSMTIHQPSGVVRRVLEFAGLAAMSLVETPVQR